jgi:hypothetical protein
VVSPKWKFYMLYRIGKNIETFGNFQTHNPCQKYTSICIDSNPFSSHTPVSVIIYIYTQSFGFLAHMYNFELYLEGWTYPS